MTRREERVARNEATSREINERIEDAHGEARSDGFIRMLASAAWSPVSG
jgi:hypothetical protein